MTLLALRIGLGMLAVVLLAAWANDASAQVSPGALSTAHAALDGGTQCFQCHAKPGAKAGMDERCLACHREIDAMRTQHRGYHATVSPKDCASCHPDHGGRAFALIAWDGGAPEKFDHARAGYRLEGRHASLACRDCHKPELQKSAIVPLLKRKDHAQSWLALERACASCHADPHRGQLGAGCTSCHDTKAWKPAKGFDHAKSAFALTGAHARIDCAKCHSPAPNPRDAKGVALLQWKPLAHHDCADCHRDPHAGRLPGLCSTCHEDTHDFRLVRTNGFHHERTRYPLLGMHASVTCAKCHDARTAFGPRPRFAECADCHRDAHNHQATLAGKPADCSACHDVSGFDHPTYTVTTHQNSSYPLEGRHAGASCQSCHLQRDASAAVLAELGSARVVLRPAHGACADCHGDPHAGRFEPSGARPRAKRCLECHSLSAFRPSTFDLAAHQTAGFALEGAHRAVPCQDCHRELSATPWSSTLAAAAPAMRALRFEDKRRACFECHHDPHDGQFATRKDKGACESCHDGTAFAPASRFSHERDANWKLEGAHARAACTSCHVPRHSADGREVVRYRPTPTRCEDCHANGVPAGSGAKTMRTSRDRSPHLAARTPREAMHVPRI